MRVKIGTQQEQKQKKKLYSVNISLYATYMHVFIYNLLQTSIHPSLTLYLIYRLVTAQETNSGTLFFN